MQNVADDNLYTTPIAMILPMLTTHWKCCQCGFYNNYWRRYPDPHTNTKYLWTGGHPEMCQGCLGNYPPMLCTHVRCERGCRDVNFRTLPDNVNALIVKLATCGGTNVTRRQEVIPLANIRHN